ncbi:MAG TPA: hypothetical protein VJ385_08485 [Fibrobacteria bacterium]|nr:hypothetical protein [Fibrobacteria bacterium]
MKGIRSGRNVGVTLLSACIAVSALSACRRDFESPYMPGSPEYAGDEWTRDANGDGVADSLDKYAPGCALPPDRCLANAKVIGRISKEENRLFARDMMLWLGDSPRPPSLEWTPEEGALRGFRLSSSDSSKVRPVNGRLSAVSVGSAQITVTVPGADSLWASFIAKVVSGGKQVVSVSAGDFTLQAGTDSTPVVTWTPADATFKDYFLQSDKPDVARIVGQKIRGLLPGKAAVVLESLDGGHKSAFSVTVAGDESIVHTDSIRSEDMYLVLGGGPAAPTLQWFPEKATDKRYKLLTILDTNVAGLNAEKTEVAPRQAGTMKVYVLAQDGTGKTAEFTVTVVSEAVAVKGIAAADLNLYAGAEPNMPKLTWSPANATNRKYSLSSGDPDVAAIQSGFIRPLSMGTSEFIVTTEDGGFRDTFTVNVGLPDSTIHLDSIQVPDFSIKLGDERRPLVTWFPADAGNRAYTLASLDTGIAQAAGESIRSMQVGSARFRLTARDGGLAKDFLVTVYPPDFPVKTITADSMWLVLGKIEEKAPALKWTPPEATNLGYTLEGPEDPSVASVVAGGRIRAKAVGATKFTVRSADGPVTTLVVIVTAIPVALTSLSAPKFTMNVGDAAKDPVVVFNPQNASNKLYTVTAPLGQNVLSVSANKVVPANPGKAVLTISANENPAIAAPCTVTVVALVKSIAARDDTLRVGSPDKDATPLLTWTPSNATDLGFSLSSSDTDIVKADGKLMKAKAGGTATLTVKASDGSGRTATFHVLVQVPVQSVTAKDVTLKTTDPEYGATPLFTFAPANATNKNWGLVYATSPAPTGIVTIVSGWKLKGVGPGKAAIAVFASDNRAIRDTFTVTVTVPVISLTASALQMKVGDPLRDPVIAWNPANATDKGYALVSLNSAILSISGNQLKAVAPGTANVVATSSDGNKADTFSVAVSQPVTSISVADLTMMKTDPDREPSVAFNPANATNRGFSLVSLNPGIASASGRAVHPVSGGTARFVATSSDGAKVDTFLVNIISPITGIQAANMTIRIGDGWVSPNVTYIPSDATDKSYTLFSPSPSTVEVRDDGKLYPVSRGTTTVYVVSAADISISSNFTVTVEKASGP